MLKNSDCQKFLLDVANKLKNPNLIVPSFLSELRTAGAIFNNLSDIKGDSNYDIIAYSLYALISNLEKIIPTALGRELKDMIEEARECGGNAFKLLSENLEAILKGEAEIFLSTISHIHDCAKKISRLADTISGSLPQVPSMNE